MGSRLSLYVIMESNRGYLLIALVVLTLLGLLGLLEELQDVGDGAYRARDAMFVVVAGLPSQLISMLPFVALLGTLFALSEMARRSEIVAIVSAGVSKRRLALWVAVPALLWSGVGMWVDTELAAPWYREAILMRSLRLSDNANVLSGTGFWARGDSRFVNIAQLEAGRVPRDIRIYEFDDAGQLSTVTEAGFADVLPDGSWQLHELHRRRFQPANAAGIAQNGDQWIPFWGRDAPLEPVPLDSLSLVELARFVGYLERTDQASSQAETVFWRRAMLPGTTLAMAGIAVPFIPSSPRSGRFGTRLAMGVGVGLAYFLGDRVLLFTGLLLGAPAMLTAVLPMFLAAGVFFWLLRNR